MQSFGLVFAGGGSRGSYQIGVWKALKELKIPITAVSGTSIGALNGAMFAQQDYDAALSIWGKINLKDVVKIEENLLDKNNLFTSRNMYSLVKELFKSSGLDTTPLRELMLKCIDEAKIRKSNIDFGLVTYSLTNHQPIELFISDIPDGMLVDYLLASSCFPGFKSTEIEKNKFIDGGVSNNMPISMLTEMGIKDIIAVNLGGYGLVKNVYCEGLNVITIGSLNEGGFFDFSRHVINRNINMGYLDTMKAFGKLYGLHYNFRSNDIEKLKRQYSQSTIIGLENAAQIYGIANDKIYRADKFLKSLLKVHTAAKKLYAETKSSINKANIIESFQKGSLKLDNINVLPLVCDILTDKWLGAGTCKIIKNLFNKEFTAANALMVLERCIKSPHIM